MQHVAPNVEEIFSAALEIRDSEARSAFLDRVCGVPGLRREVEQLLALDAGANDFLEAPASMPTLTSAFDSRPGDLEPGTTIGPYKLLEAIGEGGMGTVYMAEQAEPVRRRVALKVIKPGMDSRQVVARFEAERQALAMMDHPNIAKVFDGGLTPWGRPYFVMELVRGLPITEYCDEQQLPIAERLDLFVLVCRAVQHAHQKGVIHRDIKPSNVLVTVVDGVGVPQVIDFGVAKAAVGALTEKTLFTGFHQFVGTPLYVSPEQAELSGVDVDTRSDIYSLGVLLYELLTGTTPFDPETLRRAAFDEMRRIIREEEPQRPSTRLGSLGDQLSTVSARRKADPRRLGPSIKGELDWVVMKALEKDRRRRYETASDFAADVMRYLTDRPVEAFPPSNWYRFAKFARRNRAALATGVVLFLALTGGVAVSSWLAVRAIRAERRAEARTTQARRAVDEMYTQVAEKWLAQQPKLTAVQAEFLEKALGFYEAFAAEQGDAPEAQFEAARARHRVGVIQFAFGKFDQAAAASQQAVGQLEALAARHPTRPAYRTELAAACLSLATQEVELDRLDEAETLQKRAVSTLEAVAAEAPKGRESQVQLARSLAALGGLYERRGRYQEAEPLLRRGLGLFERLDAEGPLPHGLRDRLPNCELELGLVYRNTGRPAEAERCFRHAAQRLDRLSEDGLTSPGERSTLAVILANLASVQFDSGRLAEASESDGRAVGVLEALVAEHPEEHFSRGLLLTTRKNLLISLLAVERTEEAERVARRAVEEGDALVREYPDVPHYREDLAKLLVFAADLYSVSPTEPSHDPKRAEKLAARALEMSSASGENRGMALQSLGWARYRTGDWKGCIASLEKQSDYQRLGDFIAAMAYWQLGDKAKARKVFDRRDRWHDGYAERFKREPELYPTPAMFSRLRFEAATLMGIETPAIVPATKSP
ncbi:protein kinase [Singulisphaera sp. Ch08]|uniref:Protein kinase n=1 Tax=Singulisphaera sp. Ch08 TaxID=3120278 RepID=A0AAU7CHS9_9BACT